MEKRWDLFFSSFRALRTRFLLMVFHCLWRISKRFRKTQSTNTNLELLVLRFLTDNEKIIYRIFERRTIKLGKINSYVMLNVIIMIKMLDLWYSWFLLKLSMDNEKKVSGNLEWSPRKFLENKSDLMFKWIYSTSTSNIFWKHSLTQLNPLLIESSSFHYSVVD